MNRDRLPRLYDSSDDAWFDDETDPDLEPEEPTIRRVTNTSVRALIDIADELEAAFGRSA